MLFVDSDAKWLHFMLNQLLSNAIKYSSGSQQKILFSSQVEGREARLTVRDYGVGIPASDLKRVFQPFYTGENGRKFRESTGMGLYLVKEICIRLGHRVEIESKVGEGTAVTLIFTSHERRLASAQHPTGSALTSR